jgi:hypothetical protein
MQVESSTDEQWTEQKYKSPRRKTACITIPFPLLTAIMRQAFHLQNLTFHFKRLIDNIINYTLSPAIDSSKRLN